MPPIPTSSSRTPRVSVVMPLYNRAAEVGEALGSVLAQDYDDYEIIVVDDGSTDGGTEFVRGFGDRVKLIERKNGGAAAARNTGIGAARGELLAYCDSDDIQHPFRLMAQVEVLDRIPDAAMVFSDFETYVNGEVTRESHLRSRWLGPTTSPFETVITEAFSSITTCRALTLSVPEKYLDRRIYSGHVAPLVARMHIAWGCVQMSRLDRVRAAGGHWEAVRSYEDWCLASELSKRHPLVFMDLPTCSYRVHPGQLAGRPRLNSECYRDVILHTWRGDRAFYEAHKSIVDLILGTAYANLGEVEAREGNWNAAEENFLNAVRTWPKLKRAYLNLALASARARVPFFRGSPLDRLLPRFLEPRRRP